MGCTQSRNDTIDSVMLPRDFHESPLLPREPAQPARHTKRRRSLSEMVLHTGPNLAPAGPIRGSGTGHRDVFSVFAEHGLVLEREAAASCSPVSASHSAFSAATTASDTERTMVRGPIDQYIPSLQISYGAYSDKGMRKLNEDRQICTSQTVRDETVAYFGIYDGHNGAKVADYLTKHLHCMLFDRLRRSGWSGLKTTVEDTFAAVDEQIFHKQLDSGSTAISALVRGRQALIASVGDSQAVLSTGGRARPVSVIHTPETDSERERILTAKGVVVQGRIFGLLSVSRSFGDNDFKTSRGEYKDKFRGDLVTAIPDLMELTLSNDDEFLVLGCDGLFEVMQPQQVVDFVRAKLELHGEVQHACEELVSYAISIGSTDNVTAVVVCFNQTMSTENGLEDEVDRELSACSQVSADA
ncbi:hypothetical protein ATCC90586_006469 [Pythium insidiosum]|nr:hypothetical protein ATCC90586_006469 [Pythium insidiosum]